MVLIFLIFWWIQQLISRKILPNLENRTTKTYRKIRTGVILTISEIKDTKKVEFSENREFY